MKILSLSPDDAIGHLSVHAIRTDHFKIKKGSFISDEDATALKNTGITEIICAVAEEDDVHEDEACNYLASFLKTDNVVTSLASTGRINFTCQSLGLLRYDADRLKQINLIDEGITLALVQHNQLLASGDMIATLKIIPFFVSRHSLERVADILRQIQLFSFHPLSSKKARLIQTRFDHQSVSIFEATSAVTHERLFKLGSVLDQTDVIEHSKSALKVKLSEACSSDADLILISGASAIAHRDDLIPSTLVEIGGSVDHFGLAVDPGNLLMLGHFQDKLVIGMPGCARSPKLNGFDWILHLFFADLTIDKHELASMSAGGLLMEIASRPLPRSLSSNKPRKPHIEAVLLAAGLSSRMGDVNKLTLDVHGTPLIRRVADTIRQSNVDGLTIVLGHDAENVSKALDGINARFLFNPDYSSGQSSTVRYGLDYLPQIATDMMVFLGDMPLVTPDVVNALIESHLSLSDRWSKITLPSVKNQRGNPVIWGEAFFDEIKSLTGDSGARQLFESYKSAMNILPFDDLDLCLDADTEEDFNHIMEKFSPPLS